MTNITRDGDESWYLDSQLPYTFEHPEWVRNMNQEVKKKYNQRGLYTEDDIIHIVGFITGSSTQNCQEIINRWKRKQNQKFKQND